MDSRSRGELECQGIGVESRSLDQIGEVRVTRQAQVVRLVTIPEHNARLSILVRPLDTDRQSIRQDDPIRDGNAVRPVSEIETGIGATLSGGADEGRIRDRQTRRRDDQLALVRVLTGVAGS